jgi:chromosome segregation ATPase
VGQALDVAYGQLRELLTQFRSRMDPMGLLHALGELAESFEDRTGIALDYKNKVADLTKSREQWRLKAEQANDQLGALKAKVDNLQAKVEALTSEKKTTKPAPR